VDERHLNRTQCRPFVIDTKSNDWKRMSRSLLSHAQLADLHNRLTCEPDTASTQTATSSWAAQTQEWLQTSDSLLAKLKRVKLPALSTDHVFSPSDDMGSRVVVNGFGQGVVRFVGIHAGNSRPYIGVELDEPNGKHDGTSKGRSYFKCKPLHGVFAPPRQVTRYQEADKDGKGGKNIGKSANPLGSREAKTQ